MKLNARCILPPLAGVSLLLVSCGDFFSGDVVPPAGQMTAVDEEASGLYQEGEAAMAASKDRTARKAFKEIIKRHPLSSVAAPAHMRLGDLHEQHGEPIDAFDYYAELASKYPNSDLYAEALRRQERIAFAAVDGEIKNSFLGLKSRIPASRCAKMLERVAKNAPESERAAKARFRIGELYERKEKTTKARQAYLKVMDEHPYSDYSSEAQFRIGELLMAEAERGNQDQANLNAARNAYLDYLNLYPNGKHAGEARQKVAMLKTEDIERSFQIAEFYRKKGQNASAIFYYREVLRRKGNNPFRDRARAAITALGGKP